MAQRSREKQQKQKHINEKGIIERLHKILRKIFEIKTRSRLIDKVAASRRLWYLLEDVLRVLSDVRDTRIEGIPFNTPMELTWRLLVFTRNTFCISTTFQWEVFCHVYVLLFFFLFLLICITASSVSFSVWSLQDWETCRRYTPCLKKRI